VYKAPVSEFQITRWKLDSKMDIETVTNNKPAILILIEGKIDLCWNDQHHVIANKGQSMFIPAFLDRYKIISQKPTLIFKAEVP
jgi:mannose-6-phosphate isomerase class I